MVASRRTVLWAAISASTAWAPAADAPPALTPSDPAAEQTLRQARDALGKVFSEARRKSVASVATWTTDLRPGILFTLASTWRGGGGALVQLF
jgi:hypothetical protein